MSFEKCYYIMRLIICHYCWINEVEERVSENYSTESVDLANVLLHQEIEFD